MDNNNLSKFYASIQKSVAKIGPYAGYLNDSIVRNDAISYLHAIRYVEKNIDKFFFKNNYLTENNLVGIIITNESIHAYKSIDDLSRDANLYARKNVFPIVVGNSVDVTLPEGIVAYYPGLLDSIKLKRLDDIATGEADDLEEAVPEPKRVMHRKSRSFRFRRYG